MHVLSWVNSVLMYESGELCQDPGKPCMIHYQVVSTSYYHFERGRSAFVDIGSLVLTYWHLAFFFMYIYVCLIGVRVWQL